VTRWDWINRVTSPSGPESTTVRYALVVLVLHFFNEAKRCAWPSAATLAERTGQCEKTVRTALAEAETVGWLRRDAVPGRVTHYYPTVPEDRSLVLTPVSVTGVGRQSAPATPVTLTATPVTVTYDLRKEPRRDSRKEGPTACPFKCPACLGTMRRIAPKRGGGADFYGCRGYDQGRGCPGKRELDGTDSKAAKSEAPNLAGLAEKVFAATLQAKAQMAREATVSGPSPLEAYDPSNLTRRAKA